MATSSSLGPEDGHQVVDENLYLGAAGILGSDTQLPQVFVEQDTPVLDQAVGDQQRGTSGLAGSIK